MQMPKVGAEWSSETTTVRPLESFFMVVGAFHCWATSGATKSGAQRKRLRMDFISESPLREKIKGFDRKREPRSIHAIRDREGELEKFGVDPSSCASSPTLLQEAVRL
jgi:hypothetical protein